MSVKSVSNPLRDMENSFLYSPAEVLQHFGIKESTGLSQAQVVEARKKHGPNGTLLASTPCGWGGLFGA